MNRLIAWRNNKHHINRRETHASSAFCRTKKIGYLYKAYWYEFDHQARSVRRQMDAYGRGHRSPWCLI